MNLKHLNMGHSRFDIDHIIVPSGVTLYGMYQQSLREIYVRYNNLREELGSHNREHSLERHREPLTRHFRELCRFTSIAKHLGKNFQDATPDHLDLLAQETAIISLKLNAAMQIAVSGSLGADVMQTLMSIPKTARNEILELCMVRENALMFVANYEPPIDLSTIPNLTQAEVLEFFDHDQYLTATSRISESTKCSIGHLLENHAN